MLVCFFFQAEDGIRDADVTGVQTCALPILGGPVSRRISLWLQVTRSRTPSPPNSRSGLCGPAEHGPAISGLRGPPDALHWVSQVLLRVSPPVSTTTNSTSPRTIPAVH